MAGLTAKETGATPVVQSVAAVMWLQDWHPELRVVYAEVSGGDGQNKISNVGADGSIIESSF